MLSIGIDVGGTFTDAVVYDTTTGSFTLAKAPSTPSDPTAAVLEVLARLQVPIGDIDRFVHGVTIGTNAVLMGRGAEVWMLVTMGFRDVLEIGRTNRPVLYDIRSQKVPPLVPRTRAIEITERQQFDGAVRIALQPEEVLAALERIPPSYIEASGDLGAKDSTTFWKIILPLAMPGVAAGSIFTFSLTLGDYIIPQVIGNSTPYIGTKKLSATALS